ncbi:pyruvate decarboxylase THI3 [Crepidotus variabilis]|uniref:Pyruvate decarboxylase THI3 n=1 Tax=Crepidotus variabilis TaxID=179855 RepID=A0A9P6JNM8_9AGAR|nr:pyruvate decarboxylase THI3 [Crepidotus variabilis]
MSQEIDALRALLDRFRLEVSTLRQSSGTENITIGSYLLTRLEQLGVTSMFGLPGDFNLAFLDLVEDHPKIDWVGNCSSNELNAAYAADGYARVKETSLGVITTTFGVGELSAINGIAGSFSEMVPVLHIVGAPSTGQQKNRPLLHHTLGDGRYDAYSKAAQQFVVHESHIVNKANAAADIDTALVECITKARPVYLTLPTDMVYEEISSERLKIPLSSTRAPNDPEKEDFVSNLIHERVKEAGGDVVILVDACVIRHHVRKETLEFLHKTGFPVFATPMGKSAVPEDYNRYGGTYIGNLSHNEVKESVENAKLIISLGLLSSDFNTGNFSYHIPTNRHIELHSDHCKVQFARFEGIAFKYLLPKLADKLQEFQKTALGIKVPSVHYPIPSEGSSTTITHAWFWPRLSTFFQPKDVVVTETGTSNFGIADSTLPEGVILLNQILWGSIGWSVGSALGAALAARDVGLNRTILFVGDGSLQLTVQELSTMIRKGVTPIIFVLNNKGYTIEKFIHGKHRAYNDIADWDLKALLNTFNAKQTHKTASYTVHTKSELDELLGKADFAKADKIQLVEVMMEALDAPPAMLRQWDSKK